MEGHGGCSTCPLETACSCCAVLRWLDEKGAAVMMKIELGGWLVCWIWDGIRLLGAVRKIGRSPEEHPAEDVMEHSMEHLVSGAVVASVVQSTTDV